MGTLTRRAALALAAAAPFLRAARLPIKKAVEFDMLPTSIPIAGRFQLARDCGFEQIECPTTPDVARAEEMLAASKSAALPIHSVMNQEHWRSPLSSPDPAVVEKSLDGMRTSLRNAKLWGASTVLLVPAVVTAETSYAQAWERSQKTIKTLIPLAKELGIIIAIEEVWNKFLQSPLEFARYVDEFDSPYIRAYFDVGNVVINGYPQDWIRTLGPRIVKLHIKDFRFRNYLATDSGTSHRVPEFVSLNDGDIDFRAVHRALAEIKFTGTATVELAAGDAAYLREVNRRFDWILNGE